MARTCLRVTSIWCASRPCRCTMGINEVSVPRASNPQSQRTTSSIADRRWAPKRVTSRSGYHHLFQPDSTQTFTSGMPSNMLPKNSWI